VRGLLGKREPRIGRTPIKEERGLYNDFLARKANTFGHVSGEVLKYTSPNEGRPMRKSIIGSCLIIWAVEAGFAEAAFVIKLRNGNEFVTSRHWQEGKQVMFDVYGGVLGIDKAFVTTIEESDKPIRQAIKGQRNTGNGFQVDVADQKTETGKPVAPAETKTKVGRNAEDPILKDFSRLKEKSAHLDRMLTSEIRELLKEITGFKNMISRNSNYFIEYVVEFNEAQEIGNITETALRSRDQ
jgi:hypothetical protein